MKISLNWLKRYLEVKAPVEEISSKLTSLGFEVEGVEEFGKVYSGLIIAEVLECAPHPDSDHLSLTKVFDGKENLQVVCGAPNVKAGIKAVLAPIGFELPLPDGKTMKMKKTKIRGVESFGMLCAEDEIGLSNSHEGILILPHDAPVGKPFSELGYYDTVFELNITPNRPDALSHLGIARELAAAFNLPLKMPNATFAASHLPSTALQLNVTAGTACPHYVGRIITDVKIAPSPEWMQKLLKAIGMNPINNVVDITNFVLMDIGQPLHSFDLGKLNGGEVRVRFAEDGEKFTTLDHKEQILQNSDLAICDGNRPACLAGVMGGLESEITEQTKDVFLEAAFFNPAVVRKQSKRLGISSDSSYRFERGVDFDLQNFANDYACSLIAELAGGKIAEQKLEFISQENLPKRPPVPLREERIEKLLGLKIPFEQAKKLLEGISIKEETPGLFNIPSWRFDLEREADLIEEIARMTGYDKIPYNIPSFKAEPNDLPLQERINRKIRSSLSALGLHECLSLRLTSKKKTEWVFGNSESDKRANPAHILNPLSEELAVLPASLLPNLIFSAAENAKHQKSVRLFEVSKAQFPAPETANEKNPGFTEVPMLGIVYADPEMDFLRFKGLLNNFFKTLHVSVDFEVLQNPEVFLHIGRSCQLKLGKKILGSCGELHPAVQNKFDLKINAYLCEIDLSVLETAFLKPVYFKEFSKQMVIERDVSIEAEEDVTYASLLSKFKGFNPKYLASIELLSVYQGEKIVAGKKNLLYRFCYQAPDRTLTDEEINAVHAKLREKISGAGFVLR